MSKRGSKESRPQILLEEFNQGQIEGRIKKVFVVEEVTSWNLKDTSSFLLVSGHGRLEPSENKSKTMRLSFLQFLRHFCF